MTGENIATDVHTSNRVALLNTEKRDRIWMCPRRCGDADQKTWDRETSDLPGEILK